MLPIQIRPNIYWIGVNDRKTDLFEGLWPIQHEGVSLNSYLIDDEKKVIIDATREITLSDMLTQLHAVTDLGKIDYLVVNHMEPDHTGALLTLRELSPNVKILCSERAAKMLDDFYSIRDGVQVVKDGETLSLGAHQLQFVSTPNVHWPETMMTVETTQNILFSCDAFGGFGTLEGSIFDDEVQDLAAYEREALRYYTNIVATRSKSVLLALKKLASVQVSVIAPSHGLIWRKDPLRIKNLYQKWAELAGQPGEIGVTILHGSMYGNTARMVEAVEMGLLAEGVPFSSFDVARVHASYYLPSLWTRRGVLVGAPTYEGELFPPMAQALATAKNKKIVAKTTAHFGSYGWSGGAQRDFEAKIVELQWKSVDSFEFTGCPKADDLRNGYEFGRKFACLLKEAV